LDFKRIKAEYIAGGTSYRKLAEKYNVPFGTLRRVAKQEAWTQKRAQVEHRVNTKMVETIIENETQKAVDIVDVADRLLGKIKEVLEVVTTTQDIRHLTSALKDLREIKGIKSEADIREQEARIAKLQKEAETEEKTNDIVVNIAEEAEEYSR
jgi:hypothetical protein